MKPIKITRRNPRIKAVRKRREKQPEKILFYSTADDVERASEKKQILNGENYPDYQSI